MQFNIRLRAEFFYSIIVVGLLLIIFLFVFSSRGFVNIDKQKQALETKKERIEELKRKKNKILNNIDRLTNDREYILSYAKTFGYLDSTKNEKIIKIIRDNKNSYSTYDSGKEYIANNNEETAAINSKGVIILAIFLAICFIFYIILVSSKNLSLKRNNTVNYKGSSM